MRMERMSMREEGWGRDRDAQKDGEDEDGEDDGEDEDARG